MKIIKQGQVPEKVLRIFRGTCARCGCQVECNENEANFSGERHPGGRQQWFINCPTKMCGSVITLTEVVLRQDGPLKATLSDPNIPLHEKGMEEKMPSNERILALHPEVQKDDLILARTLWELLRNPRVVTGDLSHPNNWGMFDLIRMCQKIRQYDERP